MNLVPGRSCPLSYRYGAGSLDRPAQLHVDTLWIAGGLYGNTHALEALLEAYAAEPGDKALVFNGDFHWFDVDPSDFEAVNETVLAFHAIRGNVETELAAPGAAAGCGCGYPDWVGDATVECSNRIIERLRATARQVPEALARLRALPMNLVAQVGNARIAIVHGDADTLAGWNFSQETLSTAEGRQAANRAFDQAQADIFASSHTCLPVLRRLEHGGVIANNGAAGMPNFEGKSFGIATRVSVRPASDSIYSVQTKGLFIEATALRYDARAWRERFLAQWPAGSDAYLSYWERIANGPHYRVDQAVRPAQQSVAEIFEHD